MSTDTSSRITYEYCERLSPKLEKHQTHPEKCKKKGFSKMRYFTVSSQQNFDHQYDDPGSETFSVTATPLWHSSDDDASPHSRPLSSASVPV